MAHPSNNRAFHEPHVEEPLDSLRLNKNDVETKWQTHKLSHIINQEISMKKFKNLNGKLVSLTPFLVSDITPEYVSWLNDPQVVRYSNQRFIQHTEATCKAYFTGFRSTDNIFIKIERAADGLFAGTMTAYVSVHHQTVDVGIMVGRRSLWGSGIGQEAWNILLNWLLSQPNVRKVTAGTMKCNMAMIKLMERSGMEFEAIRPKQELLDGVPQDILYYAKYSPDVRFQELESSN